ncbi:MAG: purine-nucleoside phosphorylase, partial [Spirochaetales bacterium]|nr:purine-nucleoside phosphorylase [Candidatus Physcosoma equi]
DIVKNMGVPYRCGMMFSSNYFSDYQALGEEEWMGFAKMGALAQDMETMALYCNAMYTGKHALSIVTMTDNCITGESFKDEERMVGNANMIKLAHETAFRISKEEA